MILALDFCFPLKSELFLHYVMKSVCLAPSQLLDLAKDLHKLVWGSRMAFCREFLMTSSFFLH